MTRRVKTLTLPGIRAERLHERDNGKTFVISEMGAYDGQDFAVRAILALSRSGAQLPEGALTGGWDVLASFAFSALLGANYGELRPLLDEMLACVGYQHAPKIPLQAVTPDGAGNCPVEEITTYLTLYKAVWEHHTGFSMAASTLPMGSTSLGIDPAA